MEYSRLNKNAQKACLLANLIALIIIGGILIGLRIFFAQKIAKYSLLVDIVLGIILFILVLSTLLEPIIQHKRWKYIVMEDRIEFVHGIYFLTTTIIPMVRIQHINIEEGPIDRIYKIAKIKINTAGGSHNIEGIPKEKALEISNYIKDRIQFKVNKNFDKCYENVKDGEVK